MMTILGFLFSDKREFFPFFHWALYKSAPQEIKRYDLYINSEQSNKLTFMEKKIKGLQNGHKKFMMMSLANCKDLDCKKKYVKVIAPYLNKNSCNIFFSINEEKKIDTIGFIHNSFFLTQNCLKQ